MKLTPDDKTRTVITDHHRLLKATMTPTQILTFACLLTADDVTRIDSAR